MDGSSERDAPDGCFSVSRLFGMIIAITGFALGLAALIIVLGLKNASNHASFTSTTVNMTLSGVCGNFPVSVVFGKVGSYAHVEVPAFSCNGTTNATGEGLRFTLPSGYDADLLLPRGAYGNTTAAPYVHTYVLFCTDDDVPEIAGAYTCATKNNSIAYIQGNMLVMGTKVPEDTFFAGTVSYGPLYGFTMNYYTTNSSTAPVTSAAKPLAIVTPGLALLVGLGLSLL